MTAKGSQTAGWQIAALLIAVLAGTIALSKHSEMQSAGPASNVSPQGMARPPHKDAQGYVYPARLINEHPLYGQLARLDAEIRRLNATSAVAWQRQWQGSITPDMRLTFIPPQLPGYDEDTYAGYRHIWQQQRTEGLPQPNLTELAPDLQARLRWIERNLRTDLDRKLEGARYAEDLRLARTRAELVRKHQEALSNADLVLPRSREGTAAITSQREKILAKIESQMAQERAASQALLTEYEAKMRQEAQLAFVAAQMELWDNMKKRLQRSVTSGSKTAARLSKVLSDWQSADYSADVLEWQPSGAGVFAPDTEPTDTEFSALYEGSGRRVASVLGLRRGSLNRAIYQETALAVRKCAMELGVDVTIPPLEPPSGEDMTETIRPLLRRMWKR